MSELPRSARLYWIVVVAAGIAAVGASDFALSMSPHGDGFRLGLSVLVLAALGFAGERMAIPLLTFDETAEHTITSVAAIAAIVVLPWYAAVLVVPIAIGLAGFRRSPIKTLFNAANMTLSVTAAALAFHLVGGNVTLLSSNPSTVVRALGTMLTVSVVYYVASSLFVAIMIALVSGQKIWQVYRANHLNTVLQEATTIGLGLMFGGFWLYNPAFVPLVALPVIMAYFSIETFVRIQQETRQSVLAMSESIDHRDPFTYNHSKRVATLSVALAEELALSHEQVATIELSALVHDIGKIGIPNEILMKPGALTSDERAQMELHPIIGYDMLRHYKQFRKGLGIVRWHHETWDGAGYPDRISDTRIPLEARIVCIADAFEAMTADRPYRKAMSSEIALQRLEEASGTQFDPNLVPLFRRVCERIGEIASSPDTAGRDEAGRASSPPPHTSPPSQPVPSPQTAGSIYRSRSIRRVPASSSRCRQASITLQPEADG